MRDFQLNFFFNLGSHYGFTWKCPRKDTLKQAAESRAQSWPSLNDRRSALSKLLIFI
jgi:hypothetical protein